MNLKQKRVYLHMDENNKQLLLEVIGEQYRHYNIKQNGGFISYYSNGEISLEGEYISGNKIGDWVSYFPTGNISSNIHYIDRKIDGNLSDNIGGEWMSYYDNGNICNEGKYFEGKKVGNWNQYYYDGTVSSQMNYKDDKLDGKWTDYNPAGYITIELIFKNGEFIESIEQYDIYSHKSQQNVFNGDVNILDVVIIRNHIFNNEDSELER